MPQIGKAVALALKTAPDESLKPRPNGFGSTLVLRLPAKIFKSDDYILRLYGTSTDSETVDAGKFYFRVVKK